MAMDLTVYLTKINPDPPYGEKIIPLNRLIELQYVRTLNRPGTLTMKHPVNWDNTIRGYGGLNQTSVFDLLRSPDTILEVYLQYDGTTFLDGDTFWYGRDALLRRSSTGEYVQWQGYDNKHLLNRRIVPYPADTDEFPVPHTKKTLPADDFMKEIMLENFGPLTIDPSFGNYQLNVADPTRDMSAILTVEPLASAAPIVTKKFAHRRIGDVLRDLAQDSAELGVDLWYDIVVTDPLMGSPFLEFRTYVDQPGQDFSIGSGQEMYFGHKQGNLADETLSESYEREINVVYAKGRGEGINRLEGVSIDPVRIATSPLNRVELFWDSRNTTDVVALTDDATARLNKGRPPKKIKGKILNTHQRTYGRDFKLGDRVVGDTLYGSYDCLINQIKVKFAHSTGLRIEASLEGDLIE